MFYSLKNCPDCGQLTDEIHYCWTCEAEGCRECIRPIIGPDGDVWYVCDRCMEWEVIADAIRTEKKKTVVFSKNV